MAQQHRQRFVELRGGWLRRGRALDQDHGLASRQVRVALSALRELAEAAAIERLESFGEFTRDTGAPCRATGRGQVREATGDAMRRLVDHERARFRRELGEASPSRGRASGQKSLEAEAIAGQAGGGERRDRGAGPRYGRDDDASLGGGRDEQVARIAHERRAGVGNEGDALAVAQAADELRHAGPLVVLVQRNERPLKTELPEQAPAMPRVLGGNRGSSRENLARSGGNVAQVADRRRDDVEHARASHYKMSLTGRTAQPDDPRQGPPPMQAKLRIARNAAAALAAALVTACQLAGLPSLGGPDAAVERAERQSRQGDHAAAARSYESAARGAAAGASNALWLAAAGEWLAGADVAAAEAAIANLVPPLTAEDLHEQRRLDAEIALARGDAARAAEIMRGVSGDDAATLATRARVQFGNLRVADAVATLIARGRLLPNAADRQANQRMIVDGIQAAVLRGGSAQPPKGADPVLAGWLELGRILADAKSGALGSQRRLQAWHERYPAHPASDSLWKGVAEHPTAPGERPRQVALLLPLSGRAAPAGSAVRDGFLAAYYDEGGPSRPRVRIYDVSERDTPSAYLQALADGSDFVVGPLTREEVTDLASVADGRAVTLALNFLPDGVQVPDRFFQYALSPEDEARLAARRIVADGRTSGVTLVPQSDWGRRVQAAFAEEFAAAGGRIVDQADYLPSTADFNELLRQLLRTTGQRGSAPRADAQFIFVAAQPVHGRLIRTQLRFNYASALPMYATSDIYDPAGPGNVDLDGVIFPDMPWVLDPQGPSATAQDTAARVFPGRAGQLGRLYAFGYDAFRLVGELPRLRAGSDVTLPGLTGRLEIDGQGRVRRELDWAQIVGGRLSPWPPPPTEPVT